jgi:acyl-CoA thioesterase-2
MSVTPRPWARPLGQVLELERVGEDRFEARLDGFGGVTLGCAALAAALTSERPLHSLHTYFLRAVPLDRPVMLAVERVRDGRRFSHRRVQVRAGAELLCELMASFAAPADGFTAQDVLLDPATPAPESLPSEEEIARAEGLPLEGPGPLGGPLEWRWVDGTPWRRAGPSERSGYGAWVRPRFPLPDERAWHAAALAFLSDYHSHMSVARWLGAFGEPRFYTSLDQSLWLHRALAWDDWWHLTTEGVVAHAGRALTRRSLHARDGRLVATMAQEQLIPSAP